MAGLLPPSKSSAAKFKSSGIFQQGIQVPGTCLLKELPIPLPSHIQLRPHWSTTCRAWARVCGEWAGSLMRKHPSAKVLASAASGRPQPNNTDCTEPQGTTQTHRHTDTRLALSISRPLWLSVGTVPKWLGGSTGTWNSRNSGQGWEETGAPPWEAKEEGPG